MLLMCGMAAGFGAVFGTPVTGAVFAMEVLAIGSIKYDALIPCFVASLLADITCAAYGIHHTHYAISFTEYARLLIPFVSFDIWLLIKVIGASVLFGLAAHLFAALGFIAVFAGATNTPVACIFMGIELFGSQHMIYYAAACFTAYYFSGHTGIYGSQRIAVSKLQITLLRENNGHADSSASEKPDA